MVLKIFCGNSAKIYTVDKTFFRTRSYGGKMSLQFDISPKHELYKYLNPETEVEYDGQRYVIKGINERKTATTINAELDLSGLNSAAFAEFKRSTESFYNVCQDILAETGWTIVDSELVSKRTTLELKDVTVLDILEYCTNATAYNTCYRFDTINKIIYCIKPQNNTNPIGTYFTDELNLSDLSYKGSSSALVTKLYAYGKDGVSIASVNGGKPYIENYSYTKKVIALVWRDERYTNPQSLLDDAIVKLNTLAVPEQSYTAKVIDLAKTNPEKYSDILTYDLYNVVTLIDRNRKTRINHRIVEIKEYPENAVQNTVTLSTIAGKISGKLNTLENKFNTLDAQQLHDRTKVNEIKQDLDTTVLHVSEKWASSLNESMFTQTSEGLYLEVDKVVGTDRWSTLLQQSAVDVRIAWNNISKRIQFENAELNIYNSKDVKLMSLNSYGQDIYDNDGVKLMSLTSSGQRFYHKETHVGTIGTGYYAQNDSYKGLAFHLNYDAAFMTWAYKKSNTTDVYTMYLTYCAKALDDMEAGKLHVGCDMDFRNHNINRAILSNWGFADGSISGAFSGYYVTSFNSDGTASSWKSFELVFNNGILQSATW